VYDVETSTADHNTNSLRSTVGEQHDLSSVKLKEAEIKFASQYCVTLLNANLTPTISLLAQKIFFL
jgi:hypothetical protein